MRLKITLATKNKGKFSEISEIATKLAPHIDLLQPDINEDVEETKNTYLGNAIIKAAFYARMTKYPAIADDSGLEVEALALRPGVFSARYEKDDISRVSKLLAEISLADDKERRARFVCSMALVIPGGDIIVSSTAYRHGVIANAPRGINGFGYDPIFIPLGFDRTFAEMKAEEKNAISHRYMALSSLLDMLEIHFCDKITRWFHVGPY